MWEKKMFKKILFVIVGITFVDYLLIKNNILDKDFNNTLKSINSVGI